MSAAPSCCPSCLPKPPDNPHTLGEEIAKIAESEKKPIEDIRAAVLALLAAHGIESEGVENAIGTPKSQGLPLEDGARCITLGPAWATLYKIGDAPRDGITNGTQITIVCSTYNGNCGPKPTTETTAHTVDGKQISVATPYQLNVTLPNQGFYFRVA
ncbi:hypothetical protein IPG41_05595 [Candidatus Peregrinibacteria bacterium]|nr:MAG: hypothetical protein IPG41_05595 [Candidatus Peregrinibacteria bacterium]